MDVKCAPQIRLHLRQRRENNWTSAQKPYVERRDGNAYLFFYGVFKFCLLPNVKASTKSFVAV